MHILVRSTIGLATRTAKASVRVAGGVGAEALLGAACGGLYGIVFGGLVPLVHGQAWRIAWIAATCALAGLAIGAIGGAWHRILKNREGAGVTFPGGDAGGDEPVRNRGRHDTNDQRAVGGVGVRSLTAG